MRGCRAGDPPARQLTERLYSYGYPVPSQSLVGEEWLHIRGLVRCWLAISPRGNVSVHLLRRSDAGARELDPMHVGHLRQLLLVP